MAHWNGAFQRKYGYPASDHTARMADETRRMEREREESERLRALPGKESLTHIPTTFPVSLGGGIWTS